ncbi:MAG: alpha/beta hydrolase [Maricaulaceae bacterium]
MTPAQFYKIDGVDPMFDWLNPSIPDRLASGAIRPVERLAERTFPAVMAGRRVHFLVHGFNVRRDRGFEGLGAAAQHLQGFGKSARALQTAIREIDAVLPNAGRPEPTPAGSPWRLPRLTDQDFVVPVLWPGDSWWRGVNYPFEFGDVQATAKQFMKLFKHSPIRPAEVTFTSHSMGVQVVLETLRECHNKIDKERPRLQMPPVRSAVFMAAADDDDVLDRPDNFYKYALGLIDRIDVIGSADDRVLKTAFRLGDRLETVINLPKRSRKRRSGRPALGLNGPVFRKATPISARTGWRAITGLPQPLDANGANHRDYLPQPWQNDGKDTFSDDQIRRANGFNPTRYAVFQVIRAHMARLGGEEDAYPWPPRRSPTVDGSR